MIACCTREVLESVTKILHSSGSAFPQCTCSVLVTLKEAGLGAGVWKAESWLRSTLQGDSCDHTTQHCTNLTACSECRPTCCGNDIKGLEHSDAVCTHGKDSLAGLAPVQVRSMQHDCVRLICLPARHTRSPTDCHWISDIRVQNSFVLALPLQHGYINLFSIHAVELSKIHRKQSTVIRYVDHPHGASLHVVFPHGACCTLQMLIQSTCS